MVDSTYQTKVYFKQGGDELVIGAGGTLTVESGATVVNEGTQTFDDIVGNDASLGITGKAGSSGAGGAVAVAGGAGDSGAGGAASVTGGAGNGANAGGAASLVGGAGGAAGTGGAASIAGGVPASGNAAGGAASVTGGAGSGTGAGGNASLVAGASGAGATGNGGDVAITAGAAASTNGDGGTITLTPGAKAGSGFDGVIIERGVKLVKQGTPTAKTVSATLTAAEILAGIITVNQAAGATSAQQLPLASAMDTALPDAAAGDAFDFSVINTSTVDAEDASVTTNTGWTLVGSMDIHAYSAAGSLNSSARFRARKTGTATWTLYRLA
jgi:hypothetical protein